MKVKQRSMDSMTLLEQMQASGFQFMLLLFVFIIGIVLVWVTTELPLSRLLRTTYGSYS